MSKQAKVKQTNTQHHHYHDRHHIHESTILALLFLPANHANLLGPQQTFNRRGCNLCMCTRRVKNNVFVLASLSFGSLMGASSYCYHVLCYHVLIAVCVCLTSCFDSNCWNCCLGICIVFRCVSDTIVLTCVRVLLHLCMLLMSLLSRRAAAREGGPRPAHLRDESPRDGGGTH